MATREELLELAQSYRRGDQHPDINTKLFDQLTPEEKVQVLYWVCYPEINRRAQRRAARLLKSWLTPLQKAEWKWQGYFNLRGSEGGRFRITPRLPRTGEMEIHGKYDYEIADFCYHDEGSKLPPADVALVHYLYLVTDEPGFRVVANEHKRKLMLWDGEWKKRLNRAQKLRAQGRTQEEIFLFESFIFQDELTAEDRVQIHRILQNDSSTNSEEIVV